MTKETCVNKISICNTGKFSNFIMRAMHGILTNGDFSMDIDGGVYQMPKSEVIEPDTDAKKSKGTSKKKGTK